MKTQKIGSRGVLFTFEEPYKTNVFLIVGQNSVFLLDTFLGNKPMEIVKHYLKDNKLDSKPVVVFISHGDYDHYWGNGSFKSSIIIAHELCRKRIEDESADDLDEFKDHKQGDVEIVTPNLTFSDRIQFAEEDLEFYHSPGHTRDSSSCFDNVDKTLFVGDNIELPIPSFNDVEFKGFPRSLEEYLSRGAKTVISGHDDPMYDDTAITSSLTYVSEFVSHNVNLSKLDKKGKIAHFQSLRNIGQDLKKIGKNKEALDYFKQSEAVLEQLPDDTVGKEDAISSVRVIISELSRLA